MLVLAGEGFVSEYAKKKLKELNLPERVSIFDTTLRDGEQTPGVSFTVDEKMRIARQLDEIKVDVIEAGTPIVSEGDRKAVKEIAADGLEAEICALARCSDEDIRVALESGADSIHIFIATSDIHLEKKLGLSQREVLETAVKSIEEAKDHGVLVEFSAEDATRTDIDYLKKIYNSAEEAGADRINIPDTVGTATPHAMRKLVGEIGSVVDVPISVHCHNDFGLATANSIAGVEAGAEQLHVTVNGIGERAGNASLEEVVMGLRYLYGIEMGIQTEELVKASRLLERLTAIPVPSNKAIVGANAFAHESGIHVHGVLEHAGTYEVLSPEVVGHHRRLVLGKHAGSKSVKKYLEDLGGIATDEQVKEVTRQIKELGDKGKTVTDADVQAVAESVIEGIPEEEKVVKLKEVTVTTGSTVTPTASVRLSFRGEERTGSATGVGPVDSAISALRGVMEEISGLNLREYHLDAITGGSDALADVTVKLEDEDNNLYIAKGVKEDVVIASVEAMINGINRYFATRKR